MSAGKVVALVVNWSTPDDLAHCIETGDQYEDDLTWIVVQNAHPTIDSEPTLERLGNHHDMRFMVAGENYGHGRGINEAAEIAWALAPSDYFFIVNPDVAWTEPVVDRLRDFLDADPKRVVVGPKQMDSRNQITAAGIVGDNVHPKHRFWHARDQRNVLARDAIQGPMVAGAAMLVRVEDFFEYGGLLEAHHYYSETWFCYHATAHGRECWYYGEPWMIHEWHKSSAIGAPTTDGHVKEDRALFRRMCDEHDPPIPRD